MITIKGEKIWEALTSFAETKLSDINFEYVETNIGELDSELVHRYVCGRFIHNIYSEGVRTSVKIKFPGVREYNASNYLTGSRAPNPPRLREDDVIKIFDWLKSSTLTLYNPAYKEVFNELFTGSKYTGYFISNSEDSNKTLYLYRPDRVSIENINNYTSGLFKEVSRAYRVAPFMDSTLEYSFSYGTSLSNVLTMVKDYYITKHFVAETTSNDVYNKCVKIDGLCTMYLDEETADKLLEPVSYVPREKVYTTDYRTNDGFKFTNRRVNAVINNYILRECSECGFQSYIGESSRIVIGNILSRYGLDFEKDDDYNYAKALYNYANLNAYESDDDDYSYCGYCDRGYSEDECDYYDNVPHLTDEVLDKIHEINGVESNTSGSLDFEDVDYNSDMMSSARVNNYNYQPNFKFYNEKGENTPTKHELHLGVEIEMDKGGCNNYKSRLITSAMTHNKNYTYTMSDGSLNNGIEIATHPMTLGAHKKLMNYSDGFKTAIALGYRAHDTHTCGIHTHLSRSFFGSDKKTQLYRASLLTLVMERLWDDFTVFSRRSYSRLDQWARKKDFIEDLDINDSNEDVARKFEYKYEGDRYVALNLANRNTFELRIFRGTLKYETFMATLEFVHNLAHWVKDHNLAKAQQVTFKEIVEYIEQDNLMEYCKSRGMFAEEQPTQEVATEVCESVQEYIDRELTSVDVQTTPTVTISDETLESHSAAVSSLTGDTVVLERSELRNTEPIYEDTPTIYEFWTDTYGTTLLETLEELTTVRTTNTERGDD